MSAIVSGFAMQTPQVLATARQGSLGEPEFDALFRACASDVHAYAISMLGDRSGAEDVTALAFERLYRSRSRLDHRRGTPRAWLFAIARNAALDELRRRRRHPGQELDDERASDSGATDALERVEHRAMVRDALAALPLREREVVLLKFHGQLSNAELARALGVSESNAGTRLHRALTRLRDGCLQIDRQEGVA
ncbi:MAG TPA: sigma-70 family RNA polymerase sigma factor [Solirubrobacteraceae bacterium]|nr:sigma-70 family RNA polymerase sigma factor [Solirubrobacteraceae bacterium]